MSEQKYWQSFSELANSGEYEKRIQNEFQDETGWMDGATPRRDFLKYLGFSTAAAAMAASCKVPVKKAIPFANKPENVIPGVAKYYATTYVQDGDAIPILAKVRDGRPIKIEGNELCEFTGGGTTARAQASVLDLYDTYRLTHPKRKVGDKFEEIPTFEQLDKMIGDAMAGLGGTQVVLLTSTIISPTTKEIISKYPNLRHVQYDADSFSGMLQANGGTLPSYDLSKAKVIVSLGADFLTTWLSPVELSRQYSKTRKIDEKSPVMSKHYQFESHLSTTGACADERFTHRPSETGAVALALYAAVGGTPTASALNDKLKNAIIKVANDLKANNGAAVVISGSNDPNVQAVVNAINTSIGAFGSTINTSVSIKTRQGIDKNLHDLVAQMDGGQVGALMIYGANPAYEYHDATKFKNALKKVKLTISFNEKLDETSELCNYLVPTNHFLESWGDAEPRTGYVSFIQPTIHPLFKTRAYQTSLLKWSGQNTDYETYFKQYWTSKAGSTQAFDKMLQDGQATGITTATTATPVLTEPGITTADAINTLIAGKKRGKTELVLYQNIFIGAGKQAGNPWLQEMPDPITRACWDNYVMMSMTMAKEVLGLDLMNKKNEKAINNYEYHPEKPVVTIAAPGRPSMELPVLVIPGMDPNTIAIAVGYGRSKNLGKAAENVGQNVYGFTAFNGATTDWFLTDVTVADANKQYKIAQMQVHNSYENRTEVVKETTMATFKKDPNQFKAFRDKLAEDFAPKTGDYRSESTMYPMHSQPGLKWGMSIDMNSCNACGACIVACNAENNVPVVGKSEVIRYHDMHWLRLDRYFVSDAANPDELKTVIFQPMLCQHCDNAPCENVCPVAATNHSAEGINQMTYNRCIGTRYCANNCPYKVRRFNWADYTGADSFPNNQDQKLVGKLDDVIFQMNEDLTRMVLNPDVTVRSRGVIEKCSFCVQRVQEGKLNAKKDNRELIDGEVKTACMQACASDAIVFGNVKDKNSRISKVRDENPLRTFYVIEQIHTLPNVSYLAKIRNTDEIIEKGEHHEEKKEAKHEATH
jgi:MoCo/4Fe-4S cofactor protein with predicted Tat translocation signal